MFGGTETTSDEGCAGRPAFLPFMGREGPHMKDTPYGGL